MKKTRIMRWIRELEDWNLYIVTDELFVVRLPNGTTKDLNRKEDAEKFMLCGFYRALDSKN